MSERSQKQVKYTEIIGFDLYYRHSVFNIDKDNYREKDMKYYLQVQLVIDLECGDMID